MNFHTERMNSMSDTTWSLRAMFPTDEDWYAELDTCTALCEELAARRGHLADCAASLLKTAEQYMALQRKLDALSVFSFSHLDTDMSDAKAGEMNGMLRNTATAISEKLSFLAPELMQYSLSTFGEYCEEIPALKLYRQYAQDFFAQKEHIFDPATEGLLIRLNDLGSVYKKAFENLVVNDIIFPTVTAPDGTAITANEANYRTALENPDQEFRKTFYDALLGTYRQHVHTLACLYEGSVKSDVYLARSRSFANARSMSLFENHIPEEVYDNLLRTVRENLTPLHEYVAFRKERLGLSKLYFSDLFVPIVSSSTRHYRYEEAQELVLKATAVLGADYTALVQKAFDERWIDVYPGENKNTGAYSTGAYGYNPYILTNFTGTLDDVFTLAHELGHAMHTWFTNHTQPFVYSGYSLFCAEVASTVNEQLLSHYLLTHSTSREEKMILLDKQLDDLRGTLFRQVMFADFEWQTHRLCEAGEPLTPQKLCAIHRELNEIYYGPELTVTDALSCEWARVPHFYRAYYVYQYATGISAACAIAGRILSEGAPAVEDYKRFLRSGSSVHPISALQYAGADMSSPAPVQAAIEHFSRTLADLKKLTETDNLHDTTK